MLSADCPRRPSLGRGCDPTSLGMASRYGCMIRSAARPVTTTEPNETAGRPPQLLSLPAVHETMFAAGRYDNLSSFDVPQSVFLRHEGYFSATLALKAMKKETEISALKDQVVMRVALPSVLALEPRKFSAYQGRSQIHDSHSTSGALQDSTIARYQHHEST